MTILICTTSTLQDTSLTSVSRALEALGEEPILLETDLFPTEVQLSIELTQRESILLTKQGRSIDLKGLTSIWVRDLRGGEQLPEDLGPGVREAAIEESQTMLWGLLGCLDVFQLDHVSALQRAPSKPMQLRLAKRLGLEIPRTILTNDPAQVRAFARECTGGIISKMNHGARAIDDNGESQPIFTNAMTKEDLEDLDGLSLCPMIFQEKVQKALELRVTVVGREMFVAGIDPRGSALGADDWRRDPALVRAFRPYDGLPEAVRRRLSSLLDFCGLNFATVDLIITPEGRVVFIEFNTSISYFDFIERATGMPIANEVAALLAGKRAPRVAPPSTLPAGELMASR